MTAVRSRKTSDQRANGRFVVTTTPALVPLADEPEQQVGAGLVEQDVAKLVADDHVVAGELGELAGETAMPLRRDEQRDQFGRGHEPHAVVVLTAGHPQAMERWVFPVPTTTNTTLAASRRSCSR